MDSDKREYNSIYRAFVVNNRDPEKLGRVLVWIPDVMPNVPQDEGIWAKPANNPVGGRNEEYDDDHNFMGSCYVPGKGSYVWLFFECGNINRPYYFSALEPGNTKVLPECQQGSEYEHKWVVFKSREGRCLVISDDPDDRRVEITGKKRNLSEKPTGDKDSVYTIDENQTTILFDEREGKEKVLIRTHKGDYLHIDVDEQKLQSYFKEDMNMETGARFSLKANSIHIKSSNEINSEAGGDINQKAGGNLNNESSGDTNVLAGGNLNNEAGGDTNILAGGNLNTDGAYHSSQEGSASSASSASSSSPNKPDGERDT